MIFEVHGIVEHELDTFIVGEWIVLARLKPMIPVEAALLRMPTAEVVCWFKQGSASRRTQDTNTWIGRHASTVMLMDISKSLGKSALTSE